MGKARQTVERRQLGLALRRLREHASLSGFPANKITPISAIIDPTTANG